MHGAIPKMNKSHTNEPKDHGPLPPGARRMPPCREGSYRKVPGIRETCSGMKNRGGQRGIVDVVKDQRGGKGFIGRCCVDPSNRTYIGR